MNKKPGRTLMGLLLVVLAATPAMNVAAAPLEHEAIHAARWPRPASLPLVDAATEARIDALLARMSLEEKVGQVIQADITSVTPADLREYPLGSVLAGGNGGPGGDDRAPAPQWLAMARDFHRVALEPRAGHEPIPLLFGIDAVHGHNNIVGVPLFPHNIGLGAAHDAELERRIAAATAAEVAATGIDWAFAPTVTVPQDVRWGRSYEGYAADPKLVAAYGRAMTLGLQGVLEPGRPLAADRVAATVG